MTSRRCVTGLLLALAIAGLASRSLEAQWHTSILALRTNGSVMRPGDCVRLDLLSLDAMPVPLATRVTYRFTESFTVKDEDGKETTSTRPAMRTLPAGPVIDAFAPLQRLPLDDTFCFGEGSLPGAYQVEVALLPSASGAPVATLRTCVVFENAITAPAEASSGPSRAADCALLIRGVKRAEPGGTVYFDGTFPPSGLYKVALVRNNRVESVLDGGAYRIGPRELVVHWPLLETASGADADLVILDGATGASTTLARVTVPRGN